MLLDLAYPIRGFTGSVQKREAVVGLNIPRNPLALSREIVMIIQVPLFLYVKQCGSCRPCFDLK